jgi:uncharacterized protein GlcG (DUF336 family)
MLSQDYLFIVKYVFQKLSLLITEAYKEAHQKSVQVNITIFNRKG